MGIKIQAKCGYNATEPMVAEDKGVITPAALQYAGDEPISRRVLPVDRANDGSRGNPG